MLLPEDVGSNDPDYSTAYLGLAATALFAILTAFVVAERTAGIDRALILSLRTSASPWLTNALLAVTYTSGRLAVPATLLFVLAIRQRHGMPVALRYLLACVSAQLLDALLKFEVNRARPHGVSPRLTAAGGPSYPSADAMLAVVIFGLGMVLLTDRMRSATVRAIALASAGAFVVLAAIARVYLGAHWPSDVLGGVLAGIACAAFFSCVSRREPPVTILVAPQEA